MLVSVTKLNKPKDNIMEDNVKSTALKLAEKKLISYGWKFNARDIGWEAAQILKGLEDGLKV